MEKNDYIKEKSLEGRASPITADKLKTILEQIGKCICDIKCEIGGHGTGFFCRIPYPDFFCLKPALITNYHVLNKDDIAEDKIIKFTLNNESIHKELKITNKRKTYTDEELDVTIIELNPKEDGIEPDSFLEIDPAINCENPNDEFGNKDVYIIGNVRQYTNGKIKNIDEEGINIQHLCPTYEGMSGSPIINLNNYKIIGIHNGADKKRAWNLGTFLKEPFKLFYNLKNTNSEIINNNIKKEDIKEEIKEDIKEKIKNDINENIKEDKNTKNETDLKDNIKKDEIKNEDIDEIIIHHKIENEPRLGNIQIFGFEFVKNNKDKCKMIINGNEGPLEALYKVKKPQDLNSIIEIKLKGIKQITTMHEMFDYCQRLSSFEDISKWDTKNVTDMSRIFSRCDKLSSLPDISKWDTKNVTNMSGMFYGCNKLLSLPDISNWDTKNVTNMSGMFYNCNKLSSLPDISNWDTKNVTNMNNMFSCCQSLSILPDISKWNTQNVTDMCRMFYGLKLSTLPDISKWDIQKVTKEKMESMFSGNIKNIPEKFNKK